MRVLIARSEAIWCVLRAVRSGYVWDRDALCLVCINVRLENVFLNEILQPFIGEVDTKFDQGNWVGLSCFVGWEAQRGR